MNNKIIVQGIEVAVKQFRADDYISLTDMLKAKDGEYFVHDWLKNRNTLEYIGVWEKIHNPNFNCVEFDIIKSNAGLNRFRISASEFIARTNAISFTSAVGRYGGTYAHKDIAFEFGMWISPEFKIYLVKEFQRLKQEEQAGLQWSAKRELTKINYVLQTTAIKDILVPTLTEQQKQFVYQDEADVLNVALFGHTAKQWRDKHLTEAKQGFNVRDFATIPQLLVLASLETHNAMMIKDGIKQSDRIQKLNEIVSYQLPILTNVHAPLLLGDKSKKKTVGGTE